MLYEKGNSCVEQFFIARLLPLVQNLPQNRPLTYIQNKGSPKQKKPSNARLRFLSKLLTVIGIFAVFTQIMFIQ